MSLARGKQAAVRVKLDALLYEFEAWRGLSDQDGQLARHWSQIAAVTGSLEAAVKEVRKGLDPAGDSEADIVAGCIVVQDQLLDVQRAWEFFRAKLAQRFVTGLGPFLVTADELAWACYRPAQVAAGLPTDIAREPPLTYLNGVATPFLIARGESYAAAIGDGGVRNDRVRMLVETLPVPVIGLPWHRHVPDVVVVAHETAHAVEDDLGLGDTLRERIATAAVDADRAPAWQAWASEVFADVYASLATGPAYARALAQFVAGRRGGGRSPQPEAWGEYPTPVLRVRLCAAVCGLMGAATEANAVLEEWDAVYGAERLEEWHPGRIAEAVVAGPYPELGGHALDAVIGFRASDWTAAGQDARRLRQGTALVGRDVRHLVACAAAALADSPAQYTRKHGERVLAAVAENVDAARRHSTARGRTRAMRARQDVVDRRVAELFTRAPATPEQEVSDVQA